MMNIELSEIRGRSSEFFVLVAVLGGLILGALGATLYMEHEGHWVTGMTNQVVWGMPHVFAVFLIVAASGALNVASISSVFGKHEYTPMAPLSGLISIALLAGGLMVLVLDLGRPDRLIIAATTYNFKSIFAWNIFLYSGFFVVVGAYLWMMLELRMNKFKVAAGTFAFVWRLTLTTGTGSIFGFIMAREAFDSALMAPMFIIMSFVYGLAIYNLVVLAAYNWTGRPIGFYLIWRLKNLLRVFVAAAMYFVIVFHLTNLYAAEHGGVVAFILLNGGVYTKVFWIGQVLIGAVIPLILLYWKGTTNSIPAIATACVLVIIGGMAQMFVIIIGGQAYPLVLFPGMEVSSAFFDGVITQYTPSLYEVLLGLGGFGAAFMLIVLGIRFLPILPSSLADEDLQYRPDDMEEILDEPEKVEVAITEG